MEEIKAIETEYNGYRFRSRSEARWAVFFDACGIEYVYEPEGFKLSDGTMYLPDFYLPESNSFFEVKGIMSKFDMHKVEMLIKNSGKPCTIGYSDMTFEACSDWWGDNDYSITSNSDSWLCECFSCGKKYFIGAWGTWKCQCCDYYEGNAGFDILLRGIDGKRFDTKFEALIKARHARFEHGEKPII